MCGIAGALLPERSSGTTTLHSAIDAMVQRLAHRGPDGHGCVVDSEAGIALAHTRLAIIDLSAAGQQPMASHDGRLSITFNGEIYNYRQLRQELSADGRPWQSQTDTEVILRAYARWGRECVDHLRGMFAFGIWDAHRRELFLARDRLGIKPLYVYSSEREFVFASEVRALLASGLVPRRLDTESLRQYLAYQCAPADRTLVEGVRTVPPGTCLRVDVGNHVESWRYWDLLANASTEASADGPRERRGRVRELLRESVELHLVSDVPVGVFLSGGIDSSALVGLVREAGHMPHTFSVGFAERGLDETPRARELAQRFHTEHAEIRLGEADVLEQLPDGLRAMDQPSGDALNTYVVSRAVRAAKLKVALSGLGADELFGGYPSFTRLGGSARVLERWARLPNPIRRAAADMVEIGGRHSIAATKLGALLKSDGTLATTYPITRQVFSEAQRRELAGESPSLDPYVGLLRSAFGADPPTEPLARVAYAEARTYMHDLLLRDADQMSMAHALEVRVPFLDDRVACYVMGVPDADRHPNGTLKPLLVESVADLLPADVVRRRKHGFVLPLDTWMRGPLGPFCEVRLRRLEQRGVLQPRAIQRYWQKFLARERDLSWSRMWALVALDEWLEQNHLDA
jgi:asparagine synthase (glutamine-hydrolysing)